MLETDLNELINLSNESNNGMLITIGGRPGTGKTSFVIDIINHVSMHTKKILFFGLDLNEYLKNKITSNKVEIISDIICFKDIKSKCFETKELSMVVIDYLQLITDDSESNNIVKELKDLAISLDVPVILTTQFGRSSIVGKDSPTTSDFDEVILKYSDKLKIIK